VSNTMARTPTAVRIERISHTFAGAIIANRQCLGVLFTDDAMHSDGAMPIGMALTLNLGNQPMDWTMVVSNRYERWAEFLTHARGSRDVVFIYD